MDNRINEIRRKISSLRAGMVCVEDTMRDQIRHDLDSTEAALRLMAMRTQLAALVAEWKLARKPTRVATVAMANKTARVIWAIMARGETYRTGHQPALAA